MQAGQALGRCGRVPQLLDGNLQLHRKVGAGSKRSDLQQQVAQGHGAAGAYSIGARLRLHGLDIGQQQIEFIEVLQATLDACVQRLDLLTLQGVEDGFLLVELALQLVHRAALQESDQGLLGCQVVFLRGLGLGRGLVRRLHHLAVQIVDALFGHLRPQISQMGRLRGGVAAHRQVEDVGARARLQALFEIGDIGDADGQVAIGFLPELAHDAIAHHQFE